VNLREVLSILTTVKVSSIVFMTVVFVFSFVLRAMRWQLLLAPVKTISVHSLFASTMIGFLANNVLPLRAGEIIRGYAIARTERISVSSALATLVLERLLDGIVISLFMMALLIVFPFPAWLIDLNYVLLAIYCVGVGVSIGLLWAKGKENGWERIARTFPTSVREKVETLMGNFANGLQILGDKRKIFWVGVLSLAHWLVIALYYWIVFQACGFPLSFLAAFVVLAVLTLGIMLPAAPGYVGNFQYFTVVALSLFSVSKEDALGISFVAHAGQFIPVTIIGLFYVIRQGLTVSDLQGKASPADLGVKATPDAMRT
jgi:uncharacterized protein (TIRG00374 family)